VLLAIGAAVGVIAVVGLVAGFEPSKLPPALLNIAVYNLTFGAAAGLLAAGGLQATRESARLQRRPPLPHRRLVGGMWRFERTGIGRPPTELGIGACRTASAADRGENRD